MPAVEKPLSKVDKRVPFSKSRNERMSRMTCFLSFFPLKDKLESSKVIFELEFLFSNNVQVLIQV